jgi:hypothetical protein
MLHSVQHDNFGTFGTATINEVQGGGPLQVRRASRELSSRIRRAKSFLGFEGDISCRGESGVSALRECHREG